ncbi:MAG: hypothetical protein AAFO01_17610 [Pseudomonadota bacterium]
MIKTSLSRPMLRSLLIVGGLAVVLSGCHYHHGYFRGGFGYHGPHYGGGYSRGYGYKRHGYHHRRHSYHRHGPRRGGWRGHY